MNSLTSDSLPCAGKFGDARALIEAVRLEDKNSGERGETNADENCKADPEEQEAGQCEAALEADLEEVAVAEAVVPNDREENGAKTAIEPGILTSYDQ
ncbi:MAG TPA: hypothetical protein VGU63_00970 [Candidatus Acidoferrales bacterium]|nr:hypothetical protein [Candidatus Acidoferrales bacterium]